MIVREEELNELYKRVQIAMERFPELRYGQAVYNEAFNLFPKIVKEIPADDDCFYVDSRVPAFLSHFKVEKQWS